MHPLRTVLALLVLVPCALAGDWPQWLGPNRDSSSAEKVAPWKGDLKATWKVTVGEGHSSPVIVGDKLYLHTKVADKEEEAVTCYDTAKGMEVWKKTYPRAKFTSIFGNGPMATPAFADGKLYTFGATGILACWDAKSGDKVWMVDTLKEFKADNLGFGVASSPLVDGGKVLVNVGGKDASMVALSVKNGEIDWTSGDSKASYSSPVALGKGDSREVVFLTADGLSGLNLKSGKLRWEFPFKDRLQESATTPIELGNGCLFVSSVTLGSALVELTTKDGRTEAKEVWKNPALTCYFSTPVPVGKDHLYVVTGRTPPFARADLHCVDVKTGKPLWTEQKVGTYHAAFLKTADDKLLMLDDFGNLSLIEPNPSAFKSLAKSKVCGKTWAHPALSNGVVYLRDEKELMAVPVK